MTLIEYCKRLSSGFKDKDKAFFRLDSITYTGFNNRVREKNLRNQLNSISEIAKLYGDKEIYVLSMIDKFYSEAIKNSNSVLYRDIRVKANAFGRILGRLRQYKDEYNRVIDIDNFDFIIEQEILKNSDYGYKKKEKQKGIRRYRVYHQKTKS